MASGSYGSHFAAERWWQANGGDREDRMVALVPNEDLAAYNATTYPEGTAFIDLQAVLDGEDPGISWAGSPEDPRPITGPEGP